MAPVRIVIADDHEVVRRGLALMLGLEAGIDVVGEAADGVEAVRQVARLRPDVAILDMKMPRCDGPSAARQIKERFPEVRVLMLSGVDVDAEVFDTLELGVDGYLLKDASPEELIRAIRTVAEGHRFIHAAVTQALLERSAAVRQEKRLRAALSPRELQVLELLVTAATYREIAEELVISEETVRSHVKHILAKLDEPNRTRAVVAALQAGIISLG